MFVDLTDEQRALRLKVRDYFTHLMTPELRNELRGSEGGDQFKKIVRQMGQDGWLAVGWPKEYGGQGYGPTEQLIFFEEANIAGAPLPFVTISTVGPALMSYGTAAQKEKFLGGIASGDIHFAIGYSEPSAGSDLAVLKTAAKVEDDHFVVNGNKLWTSGADGADYIWLAARTNPDEARHKGISILIVDTKTEGFSQTVIPTSSNATAASYYDNVVVPKDMLVGELNKGWQLITAQLNHERLGLGSWADRVVGMYRKVYLWAKAADESGRRATDHAWVRRNLALCYAKLEAMRLINFRIAADIAGSSPRPDVDGTGRPERSGRREFSRCIDCCALRRPPDSSRRSGYAGAAGCDSRIISARCVYGEAGSRHGEGTAGHAPVAAERQ